MIEARLNKPSEILVKKDEYLSHLARQLGITKTLFGKATQFHERILTLFFTTLTFQRGRDHGIPSYNAWRESCGILRAKAFADLVDVIPSDAMAKLEEIYE